ncbi:MAG: DUF4097 family beta strand repeat-containing protein [Clostridiales bacterium]|nr:DUF4097 family beta strand repeat-containing protein [Clostridiales bacterium]
MDKKHFLKALGRALGTLPREEKNRALSYYREMIDDRVESGLSEEAAIASMDEVDKIAAEIKADAAERGVNVNRRSAGKTILVLFIALLISAMLIAGLVAVFSLFMGVEGCTDGGEWIRKTMQFEASEFKDLDVDLSSYKLYVGVSEDGKAHIEYYENDRVTFDIGAAGGVLKIKQKVKPLFFFGTFSNDRQMLLLLPESFNGRADLECTSGEIRIDAVKTAGEVTIDVTSGTAIIYDSSAQSFDLELTSGRIVAGRIECAGRFAVDGTSGNILLENVSCSDLHTHVTSGRIELKSIVTGSARIEATSGNVSLESFDSGDTRIDLTSGTVTGTLVGNINDYTIESHMTSGKNSLPGNYGNGARKLYAELTSGTINISFEE